MNQKSEYNAKDISVLEGLDPIRKRPGMYIGSTGNDGLHHLIKECLDNSLDEAIAGHASDITISLLADDTVAVSDDGRGIPVDKHSQTQKSALETVMTTIHAGGKFGGKAYQVSGGLHGVGVSVVCALSEWMRAEVCRNGYVYHQEYKKGVPTTKLIKGEKTNKTGTKMIFKPDPEIFKDVVFYPKKIKNHLRQQAYLTKGIKITFSDQRKEGEKKDYSFYFEGGIASYIKYLTRGIKPIHSNVFYCLGERDGVIIESSFRYTEEYESYEESFANNINTKEGGTHFTGFRAALTKTINHYARREGMIKEAEENLKGDDIREGLTCVVSVRIREPQFEGQTKNKLGNPEARPATDSLVSEYLIDFFEKNPQDARAIIGKCILSAKARKAARAVRQSVLRKGILEGLSLPGKLSDCSTKKPEESELYVIEGESAGGSCKSARDRRFQAILPLKGKVLNVERSRLDKILASKEIKSLVIAMGAAIAEDFNIEKLRYHRIILMADADSITGDSPIMIYDKVKQQFFLTKVGKFIDNCSDTTRYQVLTYNAKNKKRELKEIYQTVRHPLRTSLHKIKSHCGYSVKVTSCHSIYVYERGRVVTKEGSEIRPGDCLVFPKQFPRNDKEICLDLTDILFDMAPENISFKLEKKELNLVPENAWCELNFQSWNVLQNQRELAGVSRRKMGEDIGIYDKVIQQWEKKIDNVMPKFHQFRNYLQRLEIDQKNIDYNVYVPIKEWKERKVTNEAKFYLNNHKKEIQTKFEVDKNLSFLIGFFLGDGYYSPQKRNPNRFSFAINQEKSEKYIKILSQIIKEKFNTKTIVEKKETDNVIIVHFHSFSFKLLLLKLGLLGKKANQKFIPDIFFNVKREHQESLLRGLLQSDGFITVWPKEKVRKAIYGWRLSSLEMIEGILTILRQMGIFPQYGIYQEKDHLRKDGKVIRSNFKSYDLSVSTVDYLIKTKNIWKDHKDAPKLDRYLSVANHKRATGKKIQSISSDFVTLKVKEVTEVKNPKDMFVYDFSVVGDQNFIAGPGGILLSNSDGNHIKTLLLTLFFRYFKPIIEKGYLYLARPPLYKIQSGKRVEYAYTENDKAEILSDIKSDNVDIQRYKGLGEMNPTQLWETTMNPENRVLMQVTVEDAQEADKIFDILMGQEVPARKKFIKTHAKEAGNLDI